MTVACVPLDFTDASKALAYVGDETSRGSDQLTRHFSGLGGMAGTDSAGTQWAAAYDEGAAIVMTAAADAVRAANTVAGLLHASGANHAAADSASNPGAPASTYPSPPVFGPPSPPATLPSAWGGETTGGPPGWSFVADAVGMAWPNGHQDHLRDASTGWSSFAVMVRDAGTAGAIAIDLLNAQQSPEIPDAVAVCTEIGSHLGGLADAASSVAQACSEYADHVDQAHADIESELSDLMRDQVVIWAIGAGLTALTVGVSDAAAGAIDAGRIALAVTRIQAIIVRLVEAAKAASALIESMLAAVEQISYELKIIAREVPRSGLAFLTHELMPLRREYVAEVTSKLPQLLKDLRAAGKTDEETARAMNQARRDIGEHYKELTPIYLRKVIYGRNIERYDGDILGPTIDWLRAQGFSWQEIIESSMRTGGKDLGF